MYHIKGNNAKFERAALLIMLLRDPMVCKTILGMEYNYGTCYAYALGIAAIVRDYRFTEAIKYRTPGVISGEDITHCTRTDEEKLKEFFDFFNDGIVSEIRRYDCKNEALLKRLDFRREAEVVMTDKQRQDAWNELSSLLKKVPGSYDEFVMGVLAIVKNRDRRCCKLIKYIKTNPDADTCDILYYADHELGVVLESHAIQPERYVNLGVEVVEESYDSLGRWLCISCPENNYGLFSKDTWSSEELLTILEKYI